MTLICVIDLHSFKLAPKPDVQTLNQILCVVDVIRKCGCKISNVYKLQDVSTLSSLEKNLKHLLESHEMTTGQLMCRVMCRVNYKMTHCNTIKGLLNNIPLTTFYIMITIHHNIFFLAFTKLDCWHLILIRSPTFLISSIFFFHVIFSLVLS